MKSDAISSVGDGVLRRTNLLDPGPNGRISVTVDLLNLQQSQGFAYTPSGGYDARCEVWARRAV
jgi:hypothetical protein